LGKAKPFSIAKLSVWKAFKRVRVNQGAAGVDGQSIEEFEKDLSNNLYKLWNRMSSGSYFPPPVRRVEIPKPDGRKRPLGIPTVTARVAQIEPLMGIGRASRRYKLSAWPVNGAGNIPGR
jgi:retron-type reverse transcriptase